MDGQHCPKLQTLQLKICFTKEWEPEIDKDAEETESDNGLDS